MADFPTFVALIVLVSWIGRWGLLVRLAILTITPVCGVGLWMRPLRRFVAELPPQGLGFQSLLSDGDVYLMYLVGEVFGNAAQGLAHLIVSIALGFGGFFAVLLFGLILDTIISILRA